MRVAVFVGLFTNKKSAGVEVGDDVAVGVFDERSGKCRNSFVECGIGIDGVEDRKLFCSTHSGIVLAECGSEVHDA